MLNGLFLQNSFVAIIPQIFPIWSSGFVVINDSFKFTLHFELRLTQCQLNIQINFVLPFPSIAAFERLKYAHEK